MHTKLKLLSSASLLAFISAGWMPLFAQKSADPAEVEKKKDEPVLLQTYVVSGVRASLASAQEIKRDKLEMLT